MSVLERTLTRIFCATVAALQADPRQPWATAIRAEVDAIEDDREALKFVFGALVGLLPGSLMRLILPPPLRSVDASSNFAPDRGPLWLMGPAILVIGCGAAATLIGAAHLLTAGAPPHYAFTNVIALLVGISLWAMASLGGYSGSNTGTKAAAFSVLLLFAFALGTSAAGATRWFPVGPILIQPSLIMLPPLLILFARSQSGLTTISVAAAIMVVAAQPDRAMSAVALVATLAIAVRKPKWSTFLVACIAAMGFVYTVFAPDHLPATAFVDGVLRGELGTGIQALIAVWASVVLLIIPAVVGWLRYVDLRDVYLVFGLIWLTIILAAFFGNYPTPAAGYGGSAIVGYILSGVALPRSKIQLRQTTEDRASQPDLRDDRRIRMVSL